MKVNSQTGGGRAKKIFETFLATDMKTLGGISPSQKQVLSDDKFTTDVGNVFISISLIGVDG